MYSNSFLVRELCKSDHLNSRWSELKDCHVHICSENNFPTAAGLASSAAGYSCLGTCVWIDLLLSYLNSRGLEKKRGKTFIQGACVAPENSHTCATPMVVLVSNPTLSGNSSLLHYVSATLFILAFKSLRTPFLSTSISYFMGGYWYFSC